MSDVLDSGSVKSTNIDDADKSIQYGPQTNSWSLTNGTSYFDKTLQWVHAYLLPWSR